jgi:tetratricopeptide (TPR) repeat protein
VSARARTALIVAAVAVGAAAAVAVGAELTKEELPGDPAATQEPQARDGAPPLVLSFGVREDAETRELARGAELHASGRREEAARIFARHDSLEAKVGAAFAAWPASLDRVEQLGALYPRSALVQLHVGLARFWAGVGGARQAWREARDVEPDTPYAVRAADLLHPEFAPGLPGFVPTFDVALDRPTGATRAEQLDELARDRSARGRLRLGVALQSLGRPVSARRAFSEAAALAPNDVDALVADAVGRFEKNNPVAAFSRLGPLTRRFPDAPSVRFHLGVLLLWRGDLDEARRQLELARKAAPGSKHAREAARFLDAIRKARSD